MQDERKERTSLRITGDLPLDAPEVDDEKRQFKGTLYMYIHVHVRIYCTGLYTCIYGMYILTISNFFIHIVDEFSSIPKGSHDHGDPLTTNLYIGNINPKVTG